MILTETPLRVSLFGGGTDYPEWFLRNGGAVLGMAIDKFVYVGVKRMPPGQLGAGDRPLRYRVQYSHVDDCYAAEDVKHPAVRAALRYLARLGRDEPLEFHTFADLPGRSGLGGSSAFVVGLLRALQAHGSLPTEGPHELAREAIAFERHMIPEAVGFQDQIFAAMGGINYITFGTAFEVQRIEMPLARIIELEQSLVLVYCGTMRDTHAMAEKQIEAIPRNGTYLRALSESATLAREGLLGAEPLSAIGEMLHEAWLLKRQLHPEISSPAIDALYARGRAAGAIGGKLVGAGGGGFMLFYVPLRCQEQFLALIGAPSVRFKAWHHGSRIVLARQ